MSADRNTDTAQTLDRLFVINGIAVLARGGEFPLDVRDLGPGVRGIAVQFQPRQNLACLVCRQGGKDCLAK